MNAAEKWSKSNGDLMRPDRVTEVPVFKNYL